MSCDMVKHGLAITATEHFKFSGWTEREVRRKEERVCGCLDESLNEVVCECVCL